jgi:hypothetical protein
MCIQGRSVGMTDTNLVTACAVVAAAGASGWPAQAFLTNTHNLSPQVLSLLDSYLDRLRGIFTLQSSH